MNEHLNELKSISHDVLAPLFDKIVSLGLLTEKCTEFFLHILMYNFIYIKPLSRFCCCKRGHQFNKCESNKYYMSKPAYGKSALLVLVTKIFQYIPIWNLKPHCGHDAQCIQQSWFEHGNLNLHYILIWSIIPHEMSPYEWKIPERDVKQYKINQSKWPL